MKLSISTSLSDPIRRGDAWLPALQCYAELADEVVVMDGSSDEELMDLPDNVRLVKHLWPNQFNWDFIGQQFTRGYQECTGDWVLHADIDMLYHETDFGLIRRLFEDSPNEPAYSFWKYQFILPDRYNLKSRLVLAINKKLLGDRVKFDAGGDLCRPSIDGVEISPDTCAEARVAVYNYEKLLKTYDQIVDDVDRMAKAWHSYWGKPKLGRDAEDAFNEWIKMTKGRFAKPQQRIDLFKHPQYIIPFISNLKPHNFGHSGLGLLEVNDYMGVNNA